MRYKNNYTLVPFVWISLSVLFQMVLVGDSVLALMRLNDKSSNQYIIGWSVIFTARVKFYLAFTIVAFVSLVIYYFIRRRYINVLLCKAHLWLVFTGLVLLPIYDIVLSFFVEKEFQAHSFRIGNILFYDYPFMFSFLLLIIAFVFFILTIIKSSTSPQIKKTATESTGFLDEFSNTK